jgi:hypothetical protein
MTQGVAEWDFVCLRWALRDSNPRPAECKWETIRRRKSSMVDFVDFYWAFRRTLSVLSCAVRPV